jgi:hypothetical protein
MTWSAQYLAVGRLVVRSVTIFVIQIHPKRQEFPFATMKVGNMFSLNEVDMISYIRSMNNVI